MKENKDYNKPVRNTKNLLLQYCLSCEGNHGVYFLVMSADGAETIKCSLPLAEHFYCQLLIVLLVMVKNIYYKLHSFFFCEKLLCSEQRKLLPQKFSGETEGQISSLQPIFRIPNNRQEDKQACWVPRFFKNPCLYMVAAQLPLMACKSQAGWNSVMIFNKSIRTADDELIQRHTELQVLLNGVQKHCLHSSGRRAGKIVWHLSYD